MLPRRSTLGKRATGGLYEYEQGTGWVETLRFRLSLKGQNVHCSLPVNGRKFQEVLKKQGVSKDRDADEVYRIAWRNISDWVVAPLAFYATEIVEMPQVFFPCATDATGHTLYAKMLNGKFLRGPEPEEA